MFALSIILAIVTVIAVIIGRNFKPARPAAGLALVGMLASLAFASFYTQDVGQAVVQRSVTGTIVGSTTDAGLHVKAPWVTTLRYDVRNNTVTYVGGGDGGDYSGGSATGPQITFQDREGVTANLDIVVRYSLVPGAVEQIYARYATQEDFVNRVIANDVRQVARDVPAGYGTMQLLNDREGVAAGIRAALEERWADDEIIVESVNLQEIRYPDAVKERFAEAQNSRIEIERAEADRERAQVEAETRVIAAQGEADANAILTQSLTEEILRQRYIDALDKSSTIYVVPDGATPLITTGGVPAPTNPQAP